MIQREKKEKLEGYRSSKDRKVKKNTGKDTKWRKRASVTLQSIRLTMTRNSSKAQTDTSKSEHT